MRNTICILLSLLLCIGLLGCGAEQPAPQMEAPATTAAPVETTPPETEPAGPTPAQEQKLEKYREIASALLTTEGEYSVSNGSVRLYGSAALEYYYNQLMNLEEVDELIAAGYGGFMMDRQTLLSKFTILPNVHISTSGTYTDRLGNVEEDYFAIHNIAYNADGTVSAERINEPYYKGFRGVHEYTYDENSRIVSKKVRTAINSDTVDMLSTYEYNDAGQIVKEIQTTNDGEYTVTYSYDAQGRISKIEDFRCKYTYTYTYDESGKLTRMHKTPIGYEESFVFEEDYTYKYDGDTPIGADLYYNYYMRLSGQYPIQRYNAEIVYTCDELGNIIQENWTFSNFVSKTEERYDYVSRQIIHTYGNYYIFTK